MDVITEMFENYELTLWQSYINLNDAKGRIIVGLLIGTSLAWFLSYFVEIPKGNEVTVAEIRSCFFMAFWAFINQLMKTHEKEN